jgi:hypothetical protein
LPKPQYTLEFQADASEHRVYAAETAELHELLPDKSGAPAVVQAQ